MATQAIIWVITEGYYDSAWELKIADKLLKDNAKARKIYDKIKSNIKNARIVWLRGTW